MHANSVLGRGAIACISVAFLILLLPPVCVSQKAAESQPEADFSQALNRYPGLLPELGQLFEKLRRNVELPAPRQKSDLLPLLPASTIWYVAFPNYGEAAHRSLEIFRAELKESAVLRSAWTQGDMVKVGPQMEDFLEKFYRFSQYLGPEVVLSGEVGGSKSSLLVIAAVRKPGLRDFLRLMLKDLGERSGPDVRILDPQELAKAEDQGRIGQLVVLVRGDYVIAGPDLNAVRRFNTLLNTKAREFGSTPFGRRVAQAYTGGSSTLAAADLHKILSQFPQGNQTSQNMFDRSGFKDVEYLILNHRNVAGRAVSEMELSFLSPRHGAAAWLVGPAELGSLDFVSPSASIVAALRLKNVGEIFDDVRELSTISNPKALADFMQFEQLMGISLKNDLLNRFQGELTFEMSDLDTSQPKVGAILRVDDPDRLQSILDKILSQTPAHDVPFEQEGVTYHSILIPSRSKPVQITYSFVDGYLIVASNEKLAAEAVKLHHSPDSLLKSSKFLAAIPGHRAEASALLYEDASTIVAMQLRRLSPQLAESISRLTSESAPVVLAAYGEDRAIRSVSTSSGVDPSTILILAAIAIPNLMRARIAANEASAAATLRTVATAQIAYSVAYPTKGYARDLAMLGPDSRGEGFETPEHAGLIDATLGNTSCTADAWCTKSGYRFNLKAECKMNECKDFVVVGIPVDKNTGTRSFCSTADAIIRMKRDPISNPPVSAAECQAWPSL